MDSSHPISVLVDSFLEAAQAVVASSDPEITEARPAELTYELDQVVSNYLDAHQLSTDHYDAIHQDVVNTIAHYFGDEGSDFASPVNFDEYGNAGLGDVISFLDQHYSESVDLLHDPFVDTSAAVLDSAHHGGIG